MHVDLPSSPLVTPRAGDITNADNSTSASFAVARASAMFAITSLFTFRLPSLYLFGFYLALSLYTLVLSLSLSLSHRRAPRRRCPFPVAHARKKSVYIYKERKKEMRIQAHTHLYMRKRARPCARKRLRGEIILTLAPL